VRSCGCRSVVTIPRRGAVSALRRYAFLSSKLVHHGRTVKQGDDGWTRRAVVGATTAVALIAALTWLRFDNRPLSTVALQTPKAVIRVEVADTPATHSAGLSRRDSLTGVDGLLLKWEVLGRHPIWMADMRFPLDLIWLDADGIVLAVLEGVPPCSASPCRLYEPERTSDSLAVLELAGGAARAHGIAVGTRVRSLADTGHSQ
jgi:uncharacterized protein